MSLEDVSSWVSLVTLPYACPRCQAEDLVAWPLALSPVSGSVQCWRCSWSRVLATGQVRALLRAHYGEATPAEHLVHPAQRAWHRRVAGVWAAAELPPPTAPLGRAARLISSILCWLLLLAVRWDLLKQHIAQTTHRN